MLNIVWKCSKKSRIYIRKLIWYWHKNFLSLVVGVIIVNIGLGLAWGQMTFCLVWLPLSWIMGIFFSSYLTILGLYFLLFGTLLAVVGCFSKKLWEFSNGVNDPSEVVYIFQQSYITPYFAQNCNLGVNNNNLIYIILVLLITIYVLNGTFKYMQNEPTIYTFCIILYSFTLSMLVLLLAQSFSTFILGWELIGMTSFLLINFWGTRRATLKSAYKALVFNKFSDSALILAYIIYIYNAPNDLFLDSDHMFLLTTTVIYLGAWTCTTYNVFLLAILIAAFIKSAQFGFHFWLPDSMEAPIPASALIHSATLVSAGIYLLSQLEWSMWSQWWAVGLLFWGGLSAAYGALIAIFQTDIKKLLAYSTISHCGFMVSLVSFNVPIYLQYYLVVHGITKSIAFMSSGFCINYCKGYQDTRRFGGTAEKLVFERFVFSFATINLGGLPFTFGYFAKNNLFEFLWFHQYTSISYFYLTVLPYLSALYVLKANLLIFPAIFKGPGALVGWQNISQFELFKSIKYRGAVGGSNVLLIYFIFIFLLGTIYIYLLYKNTLLCIWHSATSAEGLHWMVKDPVKWICPYIYILIGGILAPRKILGIITVYIISKVFYLFFL